MEDLWLSTLQFALGGLLLYLPLFWLLPAKTFRDTRRAVVMGASLFWPGFAATLVHLMWTSYYCFFYPNWMRWGIVFTAFFLYSIYAFACHWLSCRLPGQPLLWFCLLSGLLAANEHWIAWNFARLPEKVPMLQEMPLLPIMFFAFFEYEVYWAVALWFAWMLLKLTRMRHNKTQSPMILRSTQ